MFGYFSHHKCGTVWVASIVQEVSAAAGLVIARHDNDSRFQGDILNWHKEHPFDFWCYTNADYTFVRGVDVQGFHVVRDPRDLIISAYFSHLYSHPEAGWPRLRHYRRFLQTLSPEEGILREMEFSAPVMADMLVWDEHPPGIRLVRFEDLIASPAASFCEMFEDLGILPERVSEWTVREIVERHSFERLSGGRKKGQEDLQHHFRKGTPGDWRNHFTRRHVAYFQNLYNVLLLRLGYETREDWARPRWFAGVRSR
ncbi:MAG TPA: sulfotransferase domain-containing protein [Bryobacteraceae bacterium]|nr:sulfotransferase domain-containing protein [Bryobacteraceae bacterium]